MSTNSKTSRSVSCLEQESSRSLQVSSDFSWLAARKSATLSSTEFSCPSPGSLFSSSVASLPLSRTAPNQQSKPSVMALWAPTLFPLKSPASSKPWTTASTATSTVTCAPKPAPAIALYEVVGLAWPRRNWTLSREPVSVCLNKILISTQTEMETFIWSGNQPAPSTATSPSALPSSRLQPLQETQQQTEPRSLHYKAPSLYSLTSRASTHAQASATPLFSTTRWTSALERQLRFALSTSNRKSVARWSISVSFRLLVASLWHWSGAASTHCGEPTKTTKK